MYMLSATELSCDERFQMVLVLMEILNQCKTGVNQCKTFISFFLNGAVSEA